MVLNIELFAQQHFPIPIYVFREREREGERAISYKQWDKPNALIVKFIISKKFVSFVPLKGKSSPSLSPQKKEKRVGKISWLYCMII